VAKIFDAIDDQLRTWIASQRLFFAGTAARVADSCGYGVPLMSYEGETNSTSIDRLPALEI
jgi:hypothetical protein